MDYWSYKNIHVILTESELERLLSIVEPDPYNKAKYKVVSSGDDSFRKSIQNKISSVLLKWYKANPSEFVSKYVERDFGGEFAQEMFPYFLRRYGGLTGLATFGKYIQDSVSCDSNHDTYHISLLKHKRFLFKKVYLFDNCIAFPAGSIQRLTGNARHFVLETKSMKIIFSEKSIQISIKF